MTRDEKLATIVARWRMQNEHGEAQDPDEVIAAHPELSGALRERFAVIGALDQAVTEELAAIPSAIGEYRILREIGRGGMGGVYEAVQTGRASEAQVLALTLTLATLGLLVAIGLVARRGIPSWR